MGKDVDPKKIKQDLRPYMKTSTKVLPQSDRTTYNIRIKDIENDFDGALLIGGKVVQITIQK